MPALEGTGKASPHAHGACCVRGAWGSSFVNDRGNFYDLVSSRFDQSHSGVSQTPDAGLLSGHRAKGWSRANSYSLSFSCLLTLKPSCANKTKVRRRCSSRRGPPGQVGGPACGRQARVSLQSLLRGHFLPQVWSFALTKGGLGSLLLTSRPPCLPWSGRGSQPGPPRPPHTQDPGWVWKHFDCRNWGHKEELLAPSVSSA